MSATFSLFFLAFVFILVSLVRFNVEGKVKETTTSQLQKSKTTQRMTSAEMEQMLLEMRAELLQQKSEIRQKKTELRRQGTEIRQQKTELRWQETEIRQQKTELRRQRLVNMRQNEKITQLQQQLFQREILPTSVPRQEGQLKRSDDLGSLESMMSQTTQRLDLLTADVQALKNAEQTLTSVNSQQDQALKDAVAAQDHARGTTYIHWGHAACPNATEKIYSGIMGGGLKSNTGSPSNFLCLSSTPVFDGHAVPTCDGVNYVYGSEYDICPEPVHQTTPLCAACRVPRASTIMLPATNVCASGWQLEYTGYLMAGYSGAQMSSEYICVDSKHDYLPATQENENENLLHYVLAKCGSLPCPPYVDGKIVVCVVCSK